MTSAGVSARNWGDKCVVGGPVEAADTRAKAEASLRAGADSPQRASGWSYLEDHPGSGELRPFDGTSMYERSFCEGLKLVPKRAKRFASQTAKHGFYRAMIHSVAPKLLSGWRKDITSEMVLNVHEDARAVVQSNAVWAIKHETTPDYINVAPALAAMNKGKPALKAIMKTLEFKKEPGLWILSLPIRPFAYQVKRPRVSNVTDPQRVREAKEYNEDIIASARADLQNETNPTQVVIFPEGTTCTDGRVSYLHNGVFEISRDGAPVVPVGLNYDLVSGDRRPDSHYKYRAFMNVGKPFYYKPEKANVRGWALVKDRVMHFIKKMPQEREGFRDYLKTRIVELQTITCGGLIGNQLLQLDRGQGVLVDKGELTCSVISKAQQLSAHTLVDPALLQVSSATELVGKAWGNLIDMGYLVPAEGEGSATVNWERMDRDTTSPTATVDPCSLLLKRAAKAQSNGQATMTFTLVELIMATKKAAKITAGYLGLEGVDDDMKTNAAIIRKVGLAWEHMLGQGWLTEDESRTATIDVAHFVAQAQEAGVCVPPRPYDTYKQDNPLRFCANSLEQKAKGNAAIDEILRQG